MKKKEIAITVNDLHVYYRDMKRFSLKKGGLKEKGSGKLFKAVKGVTFEVPKDTKVFDLAYEDALLHIELLNNKNAN